MATIKYEYYQCGEWNEGAEYNVPDSNVKNRVKELYTISHDDDKKINKGKKYRNIQIL